ncbi:hypothetical protein BADSM9389_10590 [Buttiauxella agrestis]|nr:hypothetical protein BADSM9389_10590 [Buttiauxella agrestis]
MTFAFKPLQDAKPIVCVKTYVKTYHATLFRFTLLPVVFKAAKKLFKYLLLAESGDANVKT